MEPIRKMKILKLQICNFATKCCRQYWVETFRWNIQFSYSVTQSSHSTLSDSRLCDPMNCSTTGLPVHHQHLELAQSHVYSVSDAIQPSHPVVPFSSCPPSFPASGSSPMSQFFAWPKYWSFCFSISPSSEHPGLISFTMDWLDLLAVQGILKSLLQHHSSKDQFFSTHLSL